MQLKLSLVEAGVCLFSPHCWVGLADFIVVNPPFYFDWHRTSDVLRSRLILGILDYFLDISYMEVQLFMSK